MRYEWGEWSLDRKAGLLKRSGRPITVSRKVLDCITHLVAHRDRVVGHEELARGIWGHESVSHHQLHQVIQAARRRLGDDGRSQRLIRTVGRLGYRWVGVIDDPAPTAEAFPVTRPDDRSPDHEGMAAPSTARIAAPTPEAAPSPAAPPRQSRSTDDILPNATQVANTSTGLKPHRRMGRMGRWALLPSLVLLGFLGLLGHDRRYDMPASPAAASPDSASGPPDSLPALEAALYAGDFDVVRDGLAALPPSKAESPDAMLVSMRLDLYRGRFDRARDKLEAQMLLAKAARDPIWRAKLLVFQAQLQGRMQAPASEQLDSAQMAIDLLTSAGEDTAPAVLASALERRSAGLLLLGRADDALRDLARSSDLYAAIGDARGVSSIRTQRARVWMRSGRLEDALKETQSIVADHQRQSDMIGAINAYIAMTRIQIELLRWNDALESSDRALDLLRTQPWIERRKRVLQLRALVLTQLGRLREARAALEETETLPGGRSDSPFAVPYLLAAGDDQAALDTSAYVFTESPRDDLEDIILDHREGALLLWVMAAERIALQGEPLPAPSPEQSQALREPRSIAGSIAGGRWSLALGDDAVAENRLRSALERARAKGMRYHMVLAVESLSELLIRTDRIADAENLIRDVRAYDHERFDRDFHFMQLRLRLAKAAGDRKTEQALSEKLRELAGERRLAARALASRT